MKLKLQVSKFHNSLDQKLLKLKIYKGLKKIAFFFFNAKYIKGFRNNFSIFELLYTKLHLKKSLKILYKSKKKKKKILLFGFSTNLLKPLHSAYFCNSEKFSLASLEKFSPDLVLVNNFNIKSFKTKIPVISFFSNSVDQRSFTTYKLLGNFAGNQAQLFFFNCLKLISIT